MMSRASIPGGIEPGNDASGLIGPRRVGGNQPTGIVCRCAGGEVVGERQDPVVPEAAGAFGEFTLAAGVVEPDVGHAPPLLLGGLRGDAGPGVVLAESAVLDQPSHPDFGVGVDDDHQWKHRRHLGFHQ